MGRGSENTQIRRLIATAFLSIATLALVIWSGLSAGGSRVQQFAEPTEAQRQLDVMRALVEQAPGFRLRLGTDILDDPEGAARRIVERLPLGTTGDGSR